jgi:hypothetical protein
MQLETCMHSHACARTCTPTQVRTHFMCKNTHTHSAWALWGSVCVGVCVCVCACVCVSVSVFLFASELRAALEKAWKDTADFKGMMDSMSKSEQKRRRFV